MTSEADAFSILLLEEAKRFYEKSVGAPSPEQAAYLHASLMVGFSALESHVNGLADELSGRSDTPLTSQSILLEREMRLANGEWALGTAKYYRLEDRISFLLKEYAGRDSSSYPWWSELKSGIKQRNGVVHPREAVSLTCDQVERHLRSIIDALNDLYKAVFGKGHPSYNRGVQSTMTF